MLQLAVIGDPIEHSLSPVLHRYFLEAIGEPGKYKKILVRNGEELQVVVDKLRNGELNGLNITAPWKTPVKEYLDSLTEDAKNVGAVNTIKADKGHLRGHNTDKDGFLRSLQEFVRDELIQTAVILGAGGAARAVLLALTELNLSHITVVNRTRENAENLILDVHDSGTIEAITLERDTLIRSLREYDLVVNTLPPVGRDLFAQVGFPELSGGDIRFYYDLLYAASYQDQVEDAEKAGFKSMDGLDMLIYQGISSMEFWLEKSIENRLNFTELEYRLRNQ